VQIGREVGHHFMEGHYHRLPVEVFPMDKMREALEFMKTGKHVGKVRAMALSFQFVPQTDRAWISVFRSSIRDSTRPLHNQPTNQQVVLTNYVKNEKSGKEEPVAVTVEKPQGIFHADATYLITGGAGGFGSKVCMPCGCGCWFVDGSNRP
jgi:hypothetical protein